MRTVENEVFGGVTTTPWAVHMTAAGPDYYGTGESFLYALGQEQEDTQGKVRREGSGGGGAARVALGGIEVFPWSRENNLNMLSTETSIGMGGGNGEYGLLLGENFESGVSGPSETYGNPQLSRHKHFDVLNVECWSLEQPTIFLAREQQQLAERRATNMRRRSNSLDPHHHDCSALYRSFSDDDQGDDGRASPAASRRDVERSRSMGAAALRSVESM